jgi:glycosyltransferase involved in cell wall biosynthesis
MKRLVWLTNLPAPYRRPIWERLGKNFDLNVYFLLGQENWRNWKLAPSDEYSHKFLNFKSHRFGEFEFIPRISFRKIPLRNADFLFLGSWEAPMYLLMMAVAKIRNVKVVCLYESTARSQRFNNFLVRYVKRRFYRSADLVLTFGVESTKVLLMLGVLPEKIVELFNPIAPRTIVDRSHLRLGHHFLFAGQLIERKNILAVIDAFKLVKEGHDTLTIAGKGPDSGLIKDYVRDCNLEDSVSLPGHLSTYDLEILYSKSNTLILASFIEVWGLVVNEALANGMHVVVSANCGVTDLIKLMRGVYIVENDSISISEGMEKSKSDWIGRIMSPEIANFTTIEFTEKIQSEIQLRFAT